MIQHRTVPPAPPYRVPGAQRRFAAPPGGPLRAGPGAAPEIPAPRQAGAGPAPAPIAAPAGLLPYPGPPLPQVRIRPRLLWVGLSWLLFGVLVLVGVATFVTQSAGAGAGTAPKRFFGSGEVATLELDPAAHPLVYAALDSGGYVRCEPVGANADALLVTATTTDWSVTAAGREWHAAFHLTPAVAGTYQIRCSGAGATFGVGSEAAAEPLGSELLALVVLPLVGLATAVTTTIVVLARRRVAQDRLFAPWPGRVGWPAQR